MATATLKSAMSMHTHGIKFFKGVATPVTEAVAKELAEMEGYFSIKFGEVEKAVQSVAAKIAAGSPKKTGITVKKTPAVATTGEAAVEV